MASSQNFSARFAKQNFSGQIAKREGEELRYGIRLFEKAVQNGGSAETRVRGSRYHYTRLIYVGFVGEGIRSNTFTDGRFQSLFAPVASFGGQLGTEWPFKMVGGPIKN